MVSWMTSIVAYLMTEILWNDDHQSRVARKDLISAYSAKETQQTRGW